MGILAIIIIATTVAILWPKRPKKIKIGEYEILDQNNNKINVDDNPDM